MFHDLDIHVYSIIQYSDNKDFANRHIRTKEVLGTFGKEYYLKYVFEMISSIQKGNKRIVDQRRGRPAEREQRKKDKRPDGSIRHNQTDSSPTGLSHSSISMEFVFSEFDHSEDDLLLKDINGLGLAYDDDRTNGGCLWVYGDNDIEEKIYRLEKKHLVLFHLKRFQTRKAEERDGGQKMSLVSSNNESLNCRIILKSMLSKSLVT